MNESKGRVRCEVYSRVVGYLSPLHRWNKGKLREFKERVTYDISEWSSEEEGSDQKHQHPQPA